MTKEEIRGILAGMILGDGNFAKRQGYINPSIRINHSSKQREYLKHKLALLQPLFHYQLSFQEKEIQNKNGKRYKICSFNSRVSPKLKTIWKEAYKNGIKTINRKILNRLTPQGLAIWYMDDGCCNYKNRTVMISTYTSIEENQIIVDYFKEVWGIEWKIARHKDKYFIYRGWKSVDIEKFMDLISPFIIPSMNYKLVNFYSSSHSQE